MMWSLLTAKVFLCRREPGEREMMQPGGDHGKGKKRPFHLRVVSLTSYLVPLRSGTSAAHIYASFSQP